MQKHFRRTLATSLAIVGLATTACGSPVASAPTPTPITAETVRAAFANSTMKTAHVTLQGTLIQKPNSYPVTGDGVFQLAPDEAVLLNLRVQTKASTGVIKIQEVNIGGRVYVRVDKGRWSSTLATDSATLITAYVGEETMAGTKVWHARTSALKNSVYDLWIRESDGYFVQIVDSGSSGTLTLTFDSYNKSPVILKP
jgi:hypothetical protein